uniref:Prokaryotic-type class I peptide chain release factors domain-containing protein n=1 Tax=Arcella intermedia TaxID=1963864 RepID=A0A6B2L6E3_9EUKA
MDELIGRHNEIKELLSVPRSMKETKALMKEKSQTESLVQAMNEYNQYKTRLIEAYEILSDKTIEPEMRTMAEEERDEILTKILQLEEEIIQYLIPKDIADSGSAILEIRPAAGGSEASLFGQEILDMYSNYASLRSWEFQTVHISGTDVGGIREAVCSITGEGVFGYLKYETGVHRVQRVPATESAGRVHTSTITVAVLPQADELEEIELPAKDLKIETYRAGGAGGQHVNKTESAVRITHIPTGLTAASQADRSQHRNKTLAMKILLAKVYDQESSTLNVDRQLQRKTQIGTGDRSERIRTYNYPQDRITDHRLGESFFGLDKIMRGDTLMDIHESLVALNANLELERISSSS